MSSLINNPAVIAMKAELAALKRENEILYRWLEEQKTQAAELRQILLNRGDVK